MTRHEQAARKAGWRPTRDWHVIFKDADPNSVARPLKSRETYTDNLDSLISRPLRHADSWKAACRMDNLEVSL